MSGVRMSKIKVSVKLVLPQACPCSLQAEVLYCALRWPFLYAKHPVHLEGHKIFFLRTPVLSKLFGMTTQHINLRGRIVGVTSWSIHDISVHLMPTSPIFLFLFFCTGVETDLMDSRTKSEYLGTAGLAYLKCLPEYQWSNLRSYMNYAKEGYFLR